LLPFELSGSNALRTLRLVSACRYHDLARFKKRRAVRTKSGHLSEQQPPLSERVLAIAFQCLKKLERVKGIEPSYSAWKAAALPLSYTRARIT
jgi:hypothetical protein